MLGCIERRHGGGMTHTPLGARGTVTVIPDIHNSAKNRKCACGNNLERKYTRKDGTVRYRTTCGSCRARRNGRKISGGGVRKKLKGGFRHNDCQICGWYGPCDLHRINHGKNGGRYTWDNVAVLCPNCHRLHHAGILNKELTPYSKLL